MDINKMIKGIRITAAVLVVVTILAFAYGAYENYRFYRSITTAPLADDSAEVIQEWLADYQRDMALRDKVNQDTAAAVKRLEKLGVEFDEVDK